MEIDSQGLHRSTIVLLLLSVTLGLSACGPSPVVSNSQQSSADSTATFEAAVNQALMSTAAFGTAVQQSVDATAAAALQGTASSGEEVVTSPNTPEDTVIGIAPVTRNADWTPVERDFDGVTMVLVPAGCFMMGLTDDEIDELLDRVPDIEPIIDEWRFHQQCFSVPFWIDKTEVTQSQFRTNNGIQAQQSRFVGDNLPVEQINWFEALDYCEQRGARLPTEAEWEYAARGPDSWAYPWGDEFVEGNAVYMRIGSNDPQTESVGSRPGGASWVGALDMAGNVGEWTSSLYVSYPYEASDGREADTKSRTDVVRVRRGASWRNDSVALHAAYRWYWGDPSFGGDTDGLRCALSSVTVAPPATFSIPSDPSGLGITPITRNDNWTPVERDFNGVPMVLVPAGCFMMGLTDTELTALANEIDQGQGEWRSHEQCFDIPFWIDKYEVTQAQFRTNRGFKANSNYFSGDRRPVETITWFEADAYCEQRGARLPTEAEWEYATRGPDRLTYPWGDTFVTGNTVYFESSGNQTANVGSKTGGVSWIGALDLSGNVWEWTSSRYQPYPYDATDRREAFTGNTNVLRVLRGGAWNDITVDLHAATRLARYPNAANNGFGFRCARY